MSVQKEEVIKYSNDMWQLQVTESETHGIDYLLGKADAVTGTGMKTNELVRLKEIVDAAVAGISPDRNKLLS
jgi:hypothetical protein